MAGEQTIDKLNIEINAKAKSDANDLDKLAENIQRLKSSVGAGVDKLSGIADSLGKFGTAISDLKSRSGIISSLANSLTKLNGVDTSRISGNLESVGASIKSLGAMDPELKTLISDLGSLARSGNGTIGENALDLQAKAAKVQSVIDQAALKSAKAQEGLKAIADKNAQIEASARAAATQEQNLTDSINRAIAEHQAQFGSAAGMADKAADLGATMPDYGEDAVKWPVNAPSEINAGSINELKAAIGEIGPLSEENFGVAAASTEKFAGASKKASSSVSEVGKQTRNASSWMQRMIAHMFVGMAIYRGMAAFGDAVKTGINDMAVGVSSANATMSNLATNFLYLKNSIGSAFMPILQQITPAIDAVIDKVADLFNMIGMLTASIFGNAMSITVAKKAQVDYAQTVNKSADATKKQKQANAEMISGFDELHILQEQAAPKDTDSAGAGMPDYKDMFQTVKIPENITNAADKIKTFVKDNLDTIKRMLSLAPLVIGAILVFSGANVPLGLALMAIGAATMAPEVLADWDYLTDKTNTALEKLKRLFSITGTVELALGAILAFSGANVPLGIGLIIGGITTTAVTTNWDTLGDKVKTTIDNISITLGGAEMVLGAILAFSGANVPLGIGLMIGGATTLGAATVVNWDSMKTQILNSISSATSALGGALLAIGAIFTFSGANMPLGIGLMIAGAAALGGTAVLDWSSGKAKVSTALSDITGAVSGAVLAVGAMLALTGVAVPLGIGLIAAGAIGLASVAAVNWNGMNDKVKDTVSTITATVGGAMLALGAILTFTGAAAPLGIGMMVIGAGTLATTLAVNWNSMDDQLKSTLTTITTTVGIAFLALGAILTFTGVAAPLGIALMVAGAGSLATAAVLNWNSMPKQTKDTVTQITVAVSSGLLALGAILALTGVAAPLGIALMLAGAAGLATAAALNWNSMTDEVKTTLGDILLAASTASIALGLILCLTGAGIPLGVGLILAGAAGTYAASVISGKPLEDLVQGMIDSIENKFSDGIDWLVAKYKEARRNIDGNPGGGGGSGGSGGGGVRWNASGGVYDSTSIIGVAEYPGVASNPEIVTPESIMKETFEESNEGMVSVLAQILEVAQQIAQKNTTLQMDSKEVAKTINKVNSNQGYNLGLQPT
jgi:2-keto-3-deoxy-L-rhamnonate aldolase RhmA